MEKIKFCISCPPVSVNHLYGQRGNMRYVTAEGKAYKDAIGWAIRAEVPKAIRDAIWESELEVSVWFYFKDKRKRDLDNFLKGVLDGMKRVAFKDDDQIMALHVYKSIDKECPRTVVELNLLK